MDEESSQNTPLTGLQPKTQNRSGSRRMRSNSTREQTGSDKEGQRSRASSAAKSDLSTETQRYNKARGPINEAVQSALNPIDPTHTQLPPDLINQLTSQITASVLQQLKGSQFSPPTAHDTDQMESTSSTGGSPPIDRDKVYTPPSPYRASEEAAQTASPTSPRKQAHFHPLPDSKRPPSPPFSHGALSEDSDPKEGLNTRSRSARYSTNGTCNSENIRLKPDRGERLSTGSITSTELKDSSIFDKIWGELFDDKDKPTVRLSQFLRGIAVHLIEDYEPKHSLVISPEKMQRYYGETKINNEIYPWHVIFDDRTSSISRMFRELEAQHHLVQERLDERPDVPGLTPAGFETWMTLILKAHPDQEWERLAYTALHMPVNNPDDKKERFPKELSRRQFPKDPEKLMLAKLQKVLLTHCGVGLTPREGSGLEQSKPAPSPAPAQAPAQTTAKVQDMPPPIYTPTQRAGPTDYPLSQTSTRSSVPDIDKNSLRATVSEIAVEEPSPIEVIPAPQIERERKPYVAQPGGGKHYDALDVPIVQPAETKPGHSGPPPPTKLQRSASLNNRDSKSRPSQPIAIHQKPSQPPLQMPPPVDLQPSQRPRTGSSYHRDAPRRVDRNRSPSISRRDEFPPVKSDNDVQYGGYGSPGGPEFSRTSWRPDGRYDNRASFSGEPRERDTRPRYHSISGSDGHRHYPSDDEYYRTANPGYRGPDPQYPASQAYPPNSYKSRV